MDKNFEEEALSKKLVEELPLSKEMPPHVRTRAINIAVEAKRKSEASRRPRTFAWFTVGIAAIAAMAFMMPKTAAAKTWTLISQAVEQVSSVQMDMKVRSPKGDVQTLRMAAQNGKMALDAGEGNVMYIDREGMQVYNKEENIVIKMALPAELGFMPNMATEFVQAFDLKKEIAQMEKRYGRDHIKVMPIRQEGSREVYDVIMTNPEGAGNVFLTVDAQTDLPTYIDMDGDNSEKVEIHLRYNDQVQIRPNFPSGAKVQTLDLTKLKDGADGEAIGKAFKNFNPFSETK